MRAIRLVPIVLVLLLVLAPRPSTASTVTPVQELLGLLNAERAAVGARPLVLRSDLTDIAGAWSVAMADSGTLSHNDAYFSAEVRREIGPGARAENVAYAGDVPSVHRVLMDSPPHRANLLDGRYTVVGLGAVFDGRLWWVTQDFLAAPAAPLPAPAPLSAPPAEPVVTTTTVAVTQARSEPEAPPAPLAISLAPPTPAVAASAPAAPPPPLTVALELQGAPEPLVVAAAPPTSTVGRAAAPVASPAASGVPPAGFVALLAVAASATGAVRASRAARA